MSRPFPPPTTAGSVTIGAALDQTGATNVLVALQAELNAAGNGKILEYPTNAIFRCDGRITEYSKQDRIHRFNGTEIKTTLTTHAQTDTNFDIYNSQDIVLQDGILTGKNSDPGFLHGDDTTFNDSAYNVNIYMDNGLPLRLEMTGMTFRDAWGDPWQADGDTIVDGIWWHDCTVTNAGRSGWSVLHAQNVLIEKVSFGPVGLQVHNMEPYRALGGARNIRVFDTTSTSYNNFTGAGPQFGIFAAGTKVGASPLENIVFQRNTCSGKVLQTSFPHGGRDIVFTDNSSPQADVPLYGDTGVVSFRNVGGLRHHGNTQAGAAASAVTTGCTNVVTANPLRAAAARSVAAARTAATARGWSGTRVTV